MQLEFRKVDQELLAHTSAKWNADWSSQDDRPPVYEEPLQSCQRALSGEVQVSSLNRPIWYAVVLAGGTTALALVNMIHTSHGGQLRLLRVIVAPELEMSSGEDPERRDSATAVAARAIVGALELTLQDHPSTSLKVWCSYPLSKTFLNVALYHFKDRLDVHVAGNWLTINFRV